ncbi:dipeptidase [Sulfobacillus sp. hq2]|uniref:dipeptidase n=1 Tax=Sulfobacillus sp. hq2 TaxID=2039167 RepID=UPI000CD30FC6|nr:dipeptidase [Sulfobacillus sp. hq2]POB11658.1 peptidase M20 [Sulfobacillus sp. hq2]
MSHATQALSYLKDHHAQYLEELQAFLRLPSISALSDYKSAVKDTAIWLRERLHQAGMVVSRVDETEGNPIVYAETDQDPTKPTILVYGHYDVQPVDPLDQWTHPPFTPTITDNILYARGASDDKGQVYMQLIAAEAWMKTGTLPVNLKFLFEGEEEIGSIHLDDYIRSHQDQLHADVAVISDTPMFADGVPAVCYGLRGLAALEVHIEGPRQDLHSGVFGGAVANPAHVLAQILASLHDSEGRVTVPGFYDAVDTLSATERENFGSLPFDATEFLASTGSPALYGESGYTTLERIWTRPTLEVNGMWSGFIGEGRKTIIPQSAHAKISCRLVPHQDPDDILDRVEEYLRQQCPPTVRLRIERGEGAPGSVTPLDHPATQAAVQAIRDIYHKEAAYIRMGGSIPVVVTFDTVLHIPTVLLGFALPNENFHAPNEHFHLDNFYKGAETVATLWHYLGERAES